MKFNARIGAQLLYLAYSLIFLGSFCYAATPNAAQIADGQKTKVSGTISSRNGDLVNVKETKTGTRVVVITDDTKIERTQGAFKFPRTDMDVTAMLSGLGIGAEGAGNAKEQVDAT